MERSSRRPRRRPLYRIRVALIAVMALMATAVSAVAAPGAGTAEEVERQLPVIAADDTGYEALVNTLGLRSARGTFAGQYVTIAKRAKEDAVRPRLHTEAEANQLFTEFGVFRDVRNRFRLLGSNGSWVRIRMTAEKYRVGTWAKAWDAAWSFKLVRPRRGNLTPLEDELGGSGIDPRTAVCVRAFSPKGKVRGLLAVTPSGAMTVRENAACGKNTSTLFITDSLAAGEHPRTVVEGIELDPLSFVRFVAPDYTPEPPLTENQRDLAQMQIGLYFDDLLDFNLFLLNDVRSRVDDVTDALSMTQFEAPGDEPVDLNIADLIMDEVSLVLGAIGGKAAIVNLVVKSIYNAVMLGVNAAHNANLEGPRYVESLNNDVLRTKRRLKTEYGRLFGQVGQNLEALEAQLLADCPVDGACRSDRRLAVWRQVRPDADLDTTEITRQQYVASHEVSMWKRLLPIRGVLEQPYQEYDWDWFYMWGWEDGSCETEHERAFDHWTFLQGAYIPWVQEHRIEDTYANRLPVTSTAWGDHFHADHCWDAGDVQWVDKAYSQGWTIATLQDGEDVPPLMLDADDMRRLFDVWNPDDPYYDSSGLQLSVREVACEWLTNDATSAYQDIQEHDNYFNPCHFAFPDAGGGGWVDPFWQEAPYAASVPWTEALFTPDSAELAAGRSPTDPDVVAPFVPRSTFRSCAVWEDGDVVSRSNGDVVTAYATNLYDGPLALYPIDENGNPDQANPTILARQDHLDPTLVMVYAGQLPLTYTPIAGATVGTAYLAVNADGDCVGTWTVTPMPDGPAVNYQVAEIHGDDGILDHAGLTP